MKTYPLLLSFTVLCCVAMGCVRQLDVTKVRCTHDVNCPSGYSCDINAHSCIKGDAAASLTGGRDGAMDGLYATPGSGDAGGKRDASSGPTDGPNGAGVAGNGGATTGGATASGGLSGGGGAEGTLDAPIVSATGMPCANAADCGGSSGGCAAISCPNGTYCDSTGTCSNTFNNGTACSSGGQCTSGYCVDGVCCDGKCDGQCQSCKAFGSGGKCTAAAGSPVSPRAACGGTGKCTGQCDGTNGQACTYPGSSTVCTPASCSGGNLTTASVCNGAGTCTTSTTNACTGNLCAADGTQCANSCTGTSCGTGLYCNSGVCTPTIDDGKTCSADAQCTHGHCVSGVCCATACGTCHSCSTGTCSLVSPGTSCTRGVCDNTGSCNACSQGSPCTAGVNADCQTGSTDCSTGQAVCKPANRPPTTTCGPAQSCANGIEYDQAHCLNGICPTQTTVNCPSTGCNAAGTACNAACNATTQTACGTSCCTSATQYCNGTTCQPKGNDGSGCTAAGQCTSNRCSNGYCCASGTGCNGSCCSGSTPNCSSGGTCVQCTQNSQCAAATPKCSAAGACVACTTSSDCSGGKVCTASNQCACPLGGPTSSCGTCLSWDFSSGLQGWSVANPSSTNYVDVENGELVLHYTDLNASTSGQLLVTPCPGSTVNLNGYTLTANIEILNPMTVGLQPANWIGIFVNDGKFEYVDTQYDPVGYTPISIAGTVMTTGGIGEIDIIFNFSQTFTGTIVVSNVKLTPP